MITPQNKLICFESFLIDWSLPKHTKKADENSADPGPAYKMTSSLTIRNSADGNFFIGVGAPPVKISWFARFFHWLLALFGAERRSEERLLLIEEFFVSVKNSAKEIEILHGRAEGFEQALKRAKQGGQQAYIEQLSAGLNAYRMESQLLAMELPKYLEEDDLVRFYKQSKKGLRLDWVQNFTRVIPETLLAKKVRADEFGLFDNYVVLHYDPQAKSYAETEKEKEAKKASKDPILFGLMAGRRRLYIVGDWIDEYCDLTVDQIADALGKDVVKEISSV